MFLKRCDLAPVFPIYLGLAVWREHNHLHQCTLPNDIQPAHALGNWELCLGIVLGETDSMMKGGTWM